MDIPKATIFKNWHLESCLNQNYLVLKVWKTRIHDEWIHPKEGFIKLNFDDASKGNIDLTGVGGVFRNHKGEVILVYVSNIGISMNNTLELAGLFRVIVIAKDHGFSSLSVEGDSQIIIRALQNLLNGVKVNKVSHNWRLSHGLSELGCMVTSLVAIIPKQV
jgi:hypothetical protein